MVVVKIECMLEEREREKKRGEGGEDRTLQVEVAYNETELQAASTEGACTLLYSTRCTVLCCTHTTIGFTKTA